MDSRGLQLLSRVRLREAKGFANLGLHDGAYYLAGYAVECALKARIARATRKHDFPDKKKADASHRHNLRELLKVAHLEEARLEQAKRDPVFRNNWDVGQSWSEESRYRINSAEDARALVEAVCNKNHGVLQWKTTLVSVDLDRGAQILRILDDAKLNVRVALWLYSPDYEDWRLVLSSPQFDAGDPVHAYGLVHDALEAAGVPLEKTPPIMILRMNSSFVRILRRIFGKAKSVEGMRLGGQTIGDRFVEDAYTYRVV